MSGALHPAERTRIDQVFRLLRQRAGQSNKVGLGQQGLELIHPVHCIRGSSARLRIASQPDHAHLKGLGKPGKAPADIAEADDQQRLAAELVLALGGIADHAAPEAPCLVVARLGKPPAQGEIRAIACSATARALTPRALARRMPRRASSSRGNWSVPAPIDWMKRSFVARSRRLLRHNPEITSTSASPRRCSKASISRAAKLLTPVP